MLPRMIGSITDARQALIARRASFTVAVVGVSPEARIASIAACALMGRRIVARAVCW